MKDKIKKIDMVKILFQEKWIIDHGTHKEPIFYKEEALRTKLNEVIDYINEEI